MPKPLYVTQGQSFDGRVSWEIMIPKLIFRPRDKRKISFPIKFRVKNNSNMRLKISIQIHSFTRILRFQSVSITVKGKNQIREETETQTKTVQLKISPKQEDTFRFQARYYPYLSHEPIHYLDFEYIISAFDETGKIILHSYPYGTQIPSKKNK